MHHPISSMFYSSEKWAWYLPTNKFSCKHFKSARYITFFNPQPSVQWSSYVRFIEEVLRESNYQIEISWKWMKTMKCVIKWTHARWANVGAIKLLIKTICTIKLKVNDSGILMLPHFTAVFWIYIKSNKLQSQCSVSTLVEYASIHARESNSCHHFSSVLLS